MTTSTSTDHQEHISPVNSHQTGGENKARNEDEKDNEEKTSSDASVEKRTTKEESQTLKARDGGATPRPKDLRELRILERKPSGEVIMKALSTDENTEYLASLPPYLALLHEGELVRGDSYVRMDLKPDWLDMSLLRRGQKFALRNLTSLHFADMLALIILFTFPGLRALIFTGKSDSIFKAYRRYLSTNERVMSWYEDDLWRPDSKAHRNLKMVRAMHDSVRQRMNSGDKTKVEYKSTLEGQGVTRLRTELYSEVIEEAKAAACPLFKPYRDIEDNHENINQMNMAITQFGFVGLPILYPKHFGIHGEREKDFEGFIHLWRAIGFLLGIEDRFNLCNAPLSEVRQRCEDMINHWARLSLANGSLQWFHMSRVMVEGVHLYVFCPFSFAILYLLHLLNIPYARVLAAIPLWQRLFFHVSRFINYWLFRIAFLRQFVCWFLKRQVAREMKLSKEKLKCVEERAKRIEDSPSPLNKVQDNV